ncbi:hypothetical protein WJX77_012502 [Trebouxia sp. C0004]
MVSRWQTLVTVWILTHVAQTTSRHITHSRISLQLHAGGSSEHRHDFVVPSTHECAGTGHYGLLCTFHNLVLWQKQFYYINTEDISIPEVKEGWHMWWHPYGKAMLPEHITVIHPSSLPWASDSYTMYLDQALIYNWLDQANMYHVMMETGNFIYATACKLLGACTHATSHYQILSTGYFHYGEDKGLPAGHESLKCLSSKLPRWVGDAHWDDKVVLIGKTAVGIGVQCEDPKCEWDSVPFMQRNFTLGHRQLMLDCLGVNEAGAAPSQQGTQVTIVQRRLTSGRAILNMLEVQEAIEDTGTDVHIVSLEGKTLKQQAEALASSHVYILVHGAAMALYMFLPKHAAIIEMQHYYAYSASFPANLYQRTIATYDLDYHHEVYVSPRAQDISLQQERVLSDTVYQTLTTKQQLLLWEQGVCPGNEDDLMTHCVTKWIFPANMIVDVDELKQVYLNSWQSLPTGSLLTSSQ